MTTALHARSSDRELPASGLIDSGAWGVSATRPGRSSRDAPHAAMQRGEAWPAQHRAWQDGSNGLRLRLQAVVFTAFAVAVDAVSSW